MASSFGLSLKIGLEIEFTISHLDGRAFDQSNYVSANSSLAIFPLLQQFIQSIREDFAIDVQLFYAESADGQFELALHYGDPMKVADDFLYFKLLVTIHQILTNPSYYYQNLAAHL